MNVSASTRVWVMARFEARQLLRDPSPLIAMVILPLLIIAFLRPAFKSILGQQGYAGLTGAEQAVPGLTVMFSFFVISFGGLTLFREHGWHTWSRLVVSGARGGEIVLGKMLPLCLLLAVQFSLVFGVSAVLFDFRIRGSSLALLLVFAAHVTALVGLAMLLFALCRTDQQMIVLTNVLTMMFGGFGGALVPVASLSSWAQTVGSFTPGRWAIDGFRAITLQDGSVGQVAAPVGYLVLFGLGAAALAMVLMRSDISKQSKGTRGY